MLDWSVGRIVEAPSNLKLTERTLLIVVSINAPREGVHGHESAGDLGGPGTIWEGGYRMPVIVRRPSRINPESGNLTFAIGVNM